MKHGSYYDSLRWEVQIERDLRKEPGETLVQPVTGFQVASVHSIAESSFIVIYRYFLKMP
jgi:hypothetical protein